MDIIKGTVLEIVRNTLTPEQLKQSIIYWDSRALHEGQEVKMGPTTLNVPFDGILVFVDLAPRFNWAHPCLYLFINAKDLSTEVVTASFPPFTREIPETVTIVLRYGKEPPHGRYFQIFDEKPEGDAS